MGNAARMLRTVGLLFIGTLLGAMVVTRRLEMYLEPESSLNEALAAITLVLLAFFQYSAIRNPDHPHRGHHGAPCACAGRERNGWLSLLAFAIPGIIALGIPAATLDARVAVDRGLGRTESHRVEPAEFGFEEALFVLQSEGSTKGPGFEVDVVGFVAHAPQTPAGYFLLARFVVSCCVADAVPVGMLVEYPTARQPEQDRWVKVTGRVQVRLVQGLATPVIVGRTVEEVAKPDQPYIYR